MTRRMLHPDAVIEAAQRRTGLTSFDSDSFRDGLSLMVSTANASDRLSDHGRVALEEQMVHYLAIRLKVVDYVRRHPEVLNEKIERPVIVLGAPRTGTTLTSNLLATDPARRSLLQWLIQDPVPPPTVDKLKTDPRVLALLEEEKEMLAKNPAMGSLYRASAIYPHECIFVMHSDFRSLAWESAFPNPIYSDFVMHGDMSSAYAYHRMFLQVLQSAAPGAWNLKMPSHSLHIKWVMKAYPDARLIWTHRDPFTAMGSLMSLISNAQRRHCTQPDDDYIARHYPQQIAAHLDRMVDFTREHPETPVYHLQYADMVRDPIGAMEKVYDYLGDEFTPVARAEMQAWIDVNPQGKYGKHAYNLERFGHSEASLKPYLEKYLSAFQPEREGF